MTRVQRTSPVRRAAVVTIGTELVTGLRVDTNGPEIAHALTVRGHHVVELVSVPDDQESISGTLARLLVSTDLLVVTGGLGPTHDDLTREAAAVATGLELVTDPQIARDLKPVVDRMTTQEARHAVSRQAQVLSGARVIPPDRGTAPGQVVSISDSVLILLPGPPSEMRAMLRSAIPGFLGTRATPRLIRCVGIPESQAQAGAQPIVEELGGMTLTLLAKPALVDVILLDDGAGETVLDEAASRIAHILRESVYAADERTIAQVVIDEASSRSITFATAESCTGGLISAALTDIPGASSVFLGGIVAYSNSAKTSLLGVDEDLLASHGAVSMECARAMASGVRRQLRADIAVSVTGIAGPGGATPDKPVGTVWHGIATPAGDRAVLHTTFGDREGVRLRSTALALDALRREILAH